MLFRQNQLSRPFYNTPYEDICEIRTTQKKNGSTGFDEWWKQKSDVSFSWLFLYTTVQHSQYVSHRFVLHKQFGWCTFKRKRYWKKSVDENEKLLGNKWSLVALLHDNSAAGCFNSIEFHLSWYVFFFCFFLLTNKVPVFELPTCKLPIDILLHNQSIALYSIYPYWYDADFRGIITNFRVPVEKSAMDYYSSDVILICQIDRRKHIDCIKWSGNPLRKTYHVRCVLWLNTFIWSLCYRLHIPIYTLRYCLIRFIDSIAWEVFEFVRFVCKCRCIWSYSAFISISRITNYDKSWSQCIQTYHKHVLHTTTATATVVATTVAAAINSPVSITRQQFHQLNANGASTHTFVVYTSDSRILSLRKWQRLKDQQNRKWNKFRKTNGLR